MRLTSLCEIVTSPPQTGKISFKNLKRVAKELGENMTDEELQVGVQPV